MTVHPDWEAAPPRVVALFAGGRSTIGDGGHQTGIRKRRILGSIEVGLNGLHGDDIVDRRFHGGPDRAACWFAHEHYCSLRDLYRQPDEPLEAGGFGENISSFGLTEDTVCIGDVYAIGSAVLQISQPRSPCWKLNARFGIAQFSMAVQEQRRTGWYLRVLQAGMLATGDEIRLIRQDPLRCTIATFWDIVQADPPDIERLAELAKMDGLAQEWRKRLSMRVVWLRANRPS